VTSRIGVGGTADAAEEDIVTPSAEEVGTGADD